MFKDNRLWSFFASVKLAIVLLILISAVSILGTLIPQQEAAVPFMSRLSPGVADVLRGLHLFNIFHSAWFMILVALLALNLIVCSLNRFPQTWRRYRQQPAPERADLFEKMPADQMILKQTPLAVAAEDIEHLLKKKLRGLRRKDASDNTFLYGEKGIYSYFGVYLIHASVLVIMAGVVIGFFFGFEGYVDIPEGESAAVLTLKGGRGEKKLDFAVRCDRFFIDFYDNGAPKTYRSDLTFLKDGHAVQSSATLVNHPVTFAGMRFYQANFGTIPSGDPLLVVMQNDKKIKDVKVAIGMTFGLPVKKGEVEIIRVEDDLMGMGRAVKLSIRSSEGNLQFWVFQAVEQILQANPGLMEQVPLFNPGLFKPYVFSLSQAGSRYYTGLQVASDPGVPVVAAGAFFMVAGLMVVFFSSHRQIWIRLDRKGNRTRIGIAGRSSRDPVGLEREIRKWRDAATAIKESAS